MFVSITRAKSIQPEEAFPEKPPLNKHDNGPHFVFESNLEDNF